MDQKNRKPTSQQALAKYASTTVSVTRPLFLVGQEVHESTSKVTGTPDRSCKEA